MNRRDFLALLTAGAAGLAIDPEQLLWTPKPMVVVPDMSSVCHCGRHHVGVDFTAETFKERFINPAVRRLAEEIDHQGSVRVMEELRAGDILQIRMRNPPHRLQPLIADPDLPAGRLMTFEVVPENNVVVDPRILGKAEA